ncbi:GDP-mannose 4,6-dehydratase [Spirochaetota bacterium]
MKIFITGINGFVGKELSSCLQNKGHDVYGCDINGNKKNIYNIDITDLKSVEKILLKVNPHVIFHLAAISFVDYKNPEKLFQVNVAGTVNIITSLLKLKTLPRFILISSSQVYGFGNNSTEPISESFPISPVNHYGASKAASEIIASAFNIENNIPTTIIRPFNHIGKGQNYQFIVPKLVNAFKRGDSEIDLGNTNVIRDFLDIRDVVNAYIGVMENFKNGEIYNLSSGKSTKILNIIEILQKLTNHSIKIKTKESLLRNNEIKSIVGDSSKLQKNINWSPSISLKETLQWMLE